MLLNAKLNGTAHKLLLANNFHMCKHARNSMTTTIITKSQFEMFYGDKPKVIGLFSEFGHIAYITKSDRFKKQTTKKM